MVLRPVAAANLPLLLHQAAMPEMVHVLLLLPRPFRRMCSINHFHRLNTVYKLDVHLATRQTVVYAYRRHNHERAADHTTASALPREHLLPNRPKTRS